MTRDNKHLSVYNLTIILILSGMIRVFASPVEEISLNGLWQFGINQEYVTDVTVPGLATNPAKIDTGVLWYKRTIQLPEEPWTHATLILQGARFCPAVYINGVKVSESEGGMTITRHALTHIDMKPGNNVELEIALKPLDQVDARDASRIPDADMWRSNVSSCLWDDVILKLHGPAQLARIIPFTDFHNEKLMLKWQIEKYANDKRLMIIAEVIDATGLVIAKNSSSVISSAKSIRGQTDIDLKGKCKYWSPEYPVLYSIKATLYKNDEIIDISTMNYGFREFKVKDLGFMLNNLPVELRAGTVVWHRWVRDPEARELAFDEYWFRENVVFRLKDHGANTLRFHLGMPPESFLNLCDKYGLMVQAEWSFFHGMEGSKQSLLKQWRDWFDLCMRHPSVVLIHAWNETEGDRLQIAWSALDKLLPEYPPLIIGHKDVIHIHKYWWSLFENLGLYYDSAAQFDRPIMVDEFGGNYLDGNAEPGFYPTVKESFLRFLGKGHTKVDRLKHHTLSNARVAEYWRRINAAGFSPFCILGSPDDGNHWFSGPLVNATPKPVWNALTASWSPKSVSVELWDRNFVTGETVSIPLYFFNDTNKPDTFNTEIQIYSTGDNRVVFSKPFNEFVKAFQTIKKTVSLKLPETAGDWEIKAILKNPPDFVRYPVISSWEVKTIAVKVPEKLTTAKIGIPEYETELNEFLTKYNIQTCSITDPDADILVTSKLFWEQYSENQNKITPLYSAIENKCNVVMLDIGPLYLGQGYPRNNELGPLQGAPRIKNANIDEYDLPGGIKLSFIEAPEPESHIHPADNNEFLWYNLDKEATWLWNGLRGGLIVPAAYMNVSGLNADAFCKMWIDRGADKSLFKSKSYYAYELQGYYAFSKKNNDEAVMNGLRHKVRFLFHDAPALQNVINPGAPVHITDLISEYQYSTSAEAHNLVPLIYCGKNVTRTPVSIIEFGGTKGNLIVSQLITAGRLARGFGQDGLYGIRFDPAAVQFVFNLLAYTIKE